jgi:hypothetical protein
MVSLRLEINEVNLHSLKGYIDGSVFSLCGGTSISLPIEMSTDSFASQKDLV